MIRSGLASCCVYLSYGGIQIRPMIPPTFENRVFARAGQRIYLSATLGSGGELERAFGRAEIVRIAIDPSAVGWNVGCPLLTAMPADSWPRCCRA